MKRDTNTGRFVKGTHWREPRPYWQAEWLRHEYVVNGRSASEIATQFGLHENGILYWLAKNGIPRRTVSEARRLKHWGSEGDANPMKGRTGKRNPNWRGGCCPDRQSFYLSQEWKDACREVWKRDRGRCQKCGSMSRKRSELHVHHIQSFAVPETRASVLNLVLLCPTCHSWVHSRANKAHEFISKGGDPNGR